MTRDMNKTTLSKKIGYGFASLGDAAAYGFISVFLLFFLTTIAGIPPGIAGTIVAIGAFWNAVFNPIKRQNRAETVRLPLQYDWRIVRHGHADTDCQHV